MNFTIKAIKNALTAIALIGTFTNANAIISVTDNKAIQLNNTHNFLRANELDSAITNISIPSYTGGVKTAIYNIDARSFIGIIRTNTRNYRVSKFSFLDNVGLNRNSSTPTLPPPTSDSKSYAMLLSGLGMMAFIARRRRHF